jgi:flagellar motor switch/type III secretory pathway protein FliN
VGDTQTKSDMDAAVKLAKEASASAAAEPGQDLAERFGWLPCVLSIEIPVVNFTVGDLLRLGKESIVETACHSTSDIPLRANGLLVARTEFEVIGSRLAVRITELA